MTKRAVFIEKSWVGAAGAAGIFHYAVKVDDDWYEIGAGSKLSGKRNIINGALNGRPRSDKSREKRLTGVLTPAGTTYKTDQEILDFNRRWISEKPTYDLLSENCQKYALDLIQYLVGGSFRMEIPFSSENAWGDGPGSHALSRDGYHQARATTGKAGAQYKVLAVEAEGPSAGAEYDGWYASAEASLGRAEGQVLGVGVRLEPNLNTGIGVTGGQIKAKVAGFGVTILKGFAIHTPLGSIGVGKF